MTSGNHERTAEELRQLALALLDRAEPFIDGLREQRPADHPPTCTWCPLCATVGLLRGERPELAAAIAQHADGLVTALRAALAPDRPADEPTPQPRSVQHIDIQPAGEASAGC
jgi:hypothetical protein